MRKIPTTKIGEVLTDEFMKPLGISEDSLATKLNIPTDKVKSILQDNLVITPDLSARLGRLFGVSRNYFLKLQEDIIRRKTTDQL
ncbi:HigA family addiction module antidote protein [Limosilactobacillus sp. STM2_1]|uniref:HigA family addiction module antidote protein n=1 Tax=Limosilactobacillus rudii TaxID=2759755 RepID=A0A7W3UJY9_9LACO|nr:HigA family addiction module antitoxin [Limosilactobacillus rudii]MBB1079131.1 HigA family addiction module antidote protein [Limosilactobacillus rudii]MBB1096994.1 HigA family addiction module antidote protein [Limosilactobacillus rudii]MCD7133962.1 HigA family addiction module antitoxin [Limosilactobacillus rudii]